ncbi:MAG TPA: hypothetical protein VIW45_06885 [Vicinamibacterales bacterium]
MPASAGLAVAGSEGPNVAPGGSPVVSIATATPVATEVCASPAPQWWHRLA